MKRTLRYNVGNETVEKDINYIPVRFILAVALAVLETLAVIAIVILLCLYVPYFYLLMWATEIAFVIQIAASNENPDYKVPWLLVVLVVPVAGVMLYIMSHSRKLEKKYIRRVEKLKNHAYTAVLRITLKTVCGCTNVILSRTSGRILPIRSINPS